ncbi:MAG: hypothetical protein P4L72_15650 [Parvibaculum sp.]|jgi:hypothetical protein|uniref:hypothetical protein n=1 Tax=Parvibaculum sp. TaxID=2024848 RepID=UPI002844047A|nr:hypothetical protein [Parvibaculum sp.]MDR3500650.1 hypothetical protein [Parvibaculum sp.]
MNIVSFFARSYVDALSVALAPLSGARKQPHADLAAFAARAAAEKLAAANESDLPRAA